MTINELKEDICALGFEGELSSDLHFISVSNRALKLIHSSLPRAKTAKLIAAPRSVGTYIPIYSHEPGQARSFQLTGSALSFKASGDGCFSIKDSTGLREGSFHGAYSTVKEFLYGDSTLTLHGDFSFTVTDIVSYVNLYTDSKEDIPLYLCYQSYDIKSIAEDFAEILKPPENINGKPISGARVFDGRLHLPPDFSGEAIIYYRAKPIPITDNDPAASIDIPMEYEHLLPLLVSAFLWLDDEEEKAQYYMSLYREEEMKLKRKGTGEVNFTFTDVLGWA